MVTKEGFKWVGLVDGVELVKVVVDTVEVATTDVNIGIVLVAEYTGAKAVVAGVNKDFTSLSNPAMLEFVLADSSCCFWSIWRISERSGC